MDTVRNFLLACEEGLGEFSQREKLHHPENVLLCRTPKQISDDFNTELDIARSKVGFIREEVYISFFEDDSMSVNLGETLLGHRVYFEVFINVKQAAKKPVNGIASFSFEREVANEYNKCLRQYNFFLKEIEKAYLARVCNYGDLLNALDVVEQARRHALNRISSLSKLKYFQAVRGGEESDMKKLNLIVIKLRRLIERRRPA